MKAIYKIFCITIFIVLLISQTCFAIGNSNIKNILKNDSINFVPEKNEVFDVCSSSLNDVSFLNGHVKGAVKSINSERAYKTYGLTVPDIVGAYKAGKNLKDLISNQYNWTVPISNDSGEIVSSLILNKGMTLEEANKLALGLNEGAKKDFLESVKKHIGKWYVEKIGNDINPEDIDFVSSSDKIDSFLENQGLNNVNFIKYISLSRYYTNILYVCDGNDEYGIPFSLRPDLTGLQNQKLYKLSDIIATLDKSFNEDSQSGDYNVGVPVKNSSEETIRNAASANVSTSDAGLQNGGGSSSNASNSNTTNYNGFSAKNTITIILCSILFLGIAAVYLMRGRHLLKNRI